MRILSAKFLLSVFTPIYSKQEYKIYFRKDLYRIMGANDKND